MLSFIHPAFLAKVRLLVRWCYEHDVDLISASYVEVFLASK
jgi:hypothetical protein